MYPNIACTYHVKLPLLKLLHPDIVPLLVGLLLRLGRRMLV
jgi:hypothetical protein